MTSFTAYPAGSAVPGGGIVVMTLPCGTVAFGACWNSDCGAHAKLNDWMIAHAVATLSSVTVGTG